ncbi:MAG: glycine--tRNA ligase [Euryarchaeota archaeon]|nr:glycine--tRNA ligase [Euryarchaeota archaeon]|tara:strand:+ start:5314 stop:7029 length:1716 start_codon:yes stop_codon:yes gene_type:complete
MPDEGRLERMSAMLRRRGVVLPAFDIYGGVSGLIDYGPVGASIKRRLTQKWIDHWLSHGDIVEIDSPTITPEAVLVASGHVGEFNDLMTECKGCGSVFRADHLVEHLHPNADSLNSDEIDKLLSTGIECPSCNESEWTSAQPMNLMFSTKIGAMSAGRTAYMRPETAQGMFMLYPALYRHFRQKLPFGAIQTGKGYRNEISPRQGMIRLREFNMAELEYFIDPEHPPLSDLNRRTEIVSLVPDPDGPHAGESRMSFGAALDAGIVRHPTVAWFLARTWDFLIEVGIHPAKIRFRQHASTEMAHYAEDCWDCEIHGEHGWIECVGIANRTCHDLESHESHSNTKSLRAWRQFDQPRSQTLDRLVPNGAVIGPTFRGDAGAVVAALELLTELPESFPFELTLANGNSVSIHESMVERRIDTVNVSGEWFTPHIIEPAFGIDRIIWHVLDHAYEEVEKEGEAYTFLRLSEGISSVDCVVLPLFDKEGMPDLAKEITSAINALPHSRAEMDSSKSIGRRYARADEIGVPWALTVDHTSLEDGSVTVRRRDDQLQVRAFVDEILTRMTNGTMQELF